MTLLASARRRCAMIRIMVAMLVTGSVVVAMEGQTAACSKHKDCGKEEICLQGKCAPAVGRVYVLTVQAGHVSEKKRNGEPWDLGGGLPDLRVDVKFPTLKSAAGSTRVVEDSLKPLWNDRVLLTVTAVGQELWLCMVDKDSMEDDRVHTRESTKNNCVGNKNVVSLIRRGTFSLRTKGELRLIKASITPK
jgi:hypothetical protein